MPTADPVQAEMFGDDTVLGTAPAPPGRPFVPRSPRLVVPVASVELSDEQRAVFDGIAAALADPTRQSVSIHGLAGTGKTTLAAALVRDIGRLALQLESVEARAWAEPLVASPTGKAASVLARKIGVSVSTVHRLLYVPSEDDRGRLHWHKIHEPGELAGRICIVDESSMVDTVLARDLLETGVKVIAFGDDFQLPPVNGTAFFTAADFTLRTIHRQAAGSPVIRQAHRVRDGLDYESDGDDFRVIGRSAVEDLDWADVILCWKNATRHRLNAFMRRRRGIAANAPPQLGEPVQCLQNDATGIQNGELFTVADYDADSGLVLDNGLLIRSPWFEWLHPDSTRARPWSRGETPFALGRVVTTHKSQGSEWPRVLVLDEFEGSDRARWTYTAITRASEAVRIVRRGGFAAPDTRRAELEIAAAQSAVAVLERCWGAIPDGAAALERARRMLEKARAPLPAGPA